MYNYKLFLWAFAYLYWFHGIPSYHQQEATWSGEAWFLLRTLKSEKVNTRINQTKEGSTSTIYPQFFYFLLCMNSIIPPKGSSDEALTTSCLRPRQYHGCYLSLAQVSNNSVQVIHDILFVNEFYTTVTLCKVL